MISVQEYSDKIEDVLMSVGVKRCPNKNERGSMAQMHEEGIPYFLVRDVIKQLAAAKRGEIGSFLFFRRAIHERWELLNQDHKPRRPVNLFSIPGRIERLVDAIPESLPIRDKVIEGLRSVASVEDGAEAESRLTDLDCRLIQWGRQARGEAVSEALGELIDRMGRRGYMPLTDRACFALTARIVRQQLGVPRLSLFGEIK